MRGRRICDARGGAGQRGAALIEAVIVMPLVLLLVFGVIEFSSAYHDASVTSDAARAGGRIASAQARNPEYATNAAAAVAAALKTLPTGGPQELWVYRANSQGYPGTGSDFSSCGTSASATRGTPSRATGTTGHREGAAGTRRVTRCARSRLTRSASTSRSITTS